MLELDRTIPPPVHMMGDLRLPVPNIDTLANGIRLHHMSGGSQDVNQLTILWPGGEMEASSRTVARLMSKMLREGTTQMSGAQINEMIDFCGAMLRIVSDAHYTSINVSSLNSKTLDVLPVILDMITSPTFPEHPFVLRRDSEAKELLLSQAKVMVLSAQQLTRMIKGPDNPESIVPTVEDIMAVTTDDLRAFHSRVFTCQGCMAFLSGRITDDVYRAVRDMLEAVPDLGPAVPLRLHPYHPEAPGCQFVSLDNAEQAAVTMGIPAPLRSDPDYIPLRFAVMALGGYFGSRLMKNIREDKGYTYGIASYLIGAIEGSYILISAQADARYVEPLIREVKAEIGRLAETPLDEDELIRLRQYIASTLMETLDSPFSIMDHYKVAALVGLPQGYFEEQVRWAREIDADTIMRMARKYIDPEALRIAVCS